MPTVGNDVSTTNAVYTTGAAAVAGAVAGGAGGYFLTKAIDKEKGVPTDSFLSYATAEGKLSDAAKTELEAVVNKATEPVKNAFKDLNGIKDGTQFAALTEDAKTAITSAITKDGMYTTEQAAAEIAKVTDADTLRALAQSAETKAANLAKESYIKPLVKEGKIVTDGLEGGKKALAESLQSSASKFKWWAAAKWAAIGAAVLGIVTYFMSGSKKNVD